MEELNLERWDQLTREEYERVARRVAERLPAPFKFSSLKMYEQGGQRHQVALYKWKGVQFALIPGGNITLGDDPDHPPHFSEEMLADWQETMDEYEDAPTLEEYLKDCLTPLRQVTLKPFLLEVEAKEQGITPIALDNPLISRIIGEEDRAGTTSLSFTGNQILRVETDARGHSEAVEEHPQQHHHVISSPSYAGFRLPTSDEWEHACAAGARTLFRWGDTCPTDCYPFDTFNTKEWKSIVSHYNRPNAFGLRIAVNPYDWEMCLEPGIMRGGDGGGAICGGEGCVAGWLPLASAYVCHYKADQEQYGAFCRRVFSLNL